MNLILFVPLVFLGEPGLSLEAAPGAKGEPGMPGRFGYDGHPGRIIE